MHLTRHVSEFACRDIICDRDTIEWLEQMALDCDGDILRYQELTADSV